MVFKMKDKLKDFWNENWHFIIFFAIIGIVIWSTGVFPHTYRHEGKTARFDCYENYGNTFCSENEMEYAGLFARIEHYEFKCFKTPRSSEIDYFRFTNEETKICDELYK